jgi:hypothetical protein
MGWCPKCPSIKGHKPSVSTVNTGQIGHVARLHVNTCSHQMCFSHIFLSLINQFLCSQFWTVTYPLLVLDRVTYCCRWHVMV